MSRNARAIGGSARIRLHYRFGPFARRVDVVGRGPSVFAVGKGGTALIWRREFRSVISQPNPANCLNRPEHARRFLGVFAVLLSKSTSERAFFNINLAVQHPGYHS